MLICQTNFFSAEKYFAITEGVINICSKNLECYRKAFFWKKGKKKKKAESGWSLSESGRPTMQWPPHFCQPLAGGATDKSHGSRLSVLASLQSATKGVFPKGRANLERSSHISPGNGAAVLWEKCTEKLGQESWLCHVGAVWCWPNPRTSMKVTFQKQEKQPPPYKTVVRINETVIRKHFSKCKINIW